MRPVRPALRVEPRSSQSTLRPVVQIAQYVVRVGLGSPQSSDNCFAPAGPRTLGGKHVLARGADFLCARVLYRYASAARVLSRRVPVLSHTSDVLGGIEVSEYGVGPLSQVIRWSSSMRRSRCRVALCGIAQGRES